MELSRVCKYVTRRIDPSTLTVENYISTENMMQNKGGVVSASKVPTEKAVEFLPGDILISNIRPYFKKIWLADKKGGCSSDVLCIRALSGTESTYLYYLLAQDAFFDYVMTGAKGSKMPRGDKSQIMRWEVDLPSIDEQRRVASILKSIDDKIALNNRINHNLEEQAQALYKSWFVDFEPFKDSEFVDSELRRIPKGWRVLPFLNVAKLCSGGTPKTDVESYWEGEIPFFTPKDVKDSAFCLSTEKSITESGLKHCNSQLYSTFTTFITARGTVGKICMAGVPMAMNQTNYAICPKLTIDPVILYLMSRQLILSLKNKANGAVFDAITTRDFEGERVILPDDGILMKFASIVHPMYERILHNEKLSIALVSSRDSLLAKLLSGKEVHLTC